MEKKPKQKTSNVRQIYMKAPIQAALDALCELKGKSVSEMLTAKAVSEIRRNAPLMREHGIAIPAEVFE